MKNILEIHWEIQWKSIGNPAGIRPASDWYLAGIQLASGRNLAGFRPASGRISSRLLSSSKNILAASSKNILGAIQ